MPITRTSTFDNATGEYTHTFQLVADRTWLGFPQYLVEDVRGCEHQLRALGLVKVDWDVWTISDVVMHGGHAPLFRAWRLVRHHYWNLLRTLLRHGFLEKPQGEAFSWRRHFRPLGNATRPANGIATRRRYGSPIAFTRWSPVDGCA